MSGKRKGNFSGYAPYMQAMKRVKKTAAPPAPARRTSAQMARARAPQRGFVGAAGEAKFFDIAAGTLPLNTTGSISHLDIVPTGTTVSSRDGRKFKNTAMQIRGFAVSDTTTQYAIGAMYLVWDHNPNKSLAAITDVLDSVSANSFAKRENSQRFKIIKKWRWAFNGTGTSPTSATCFDIDDYVRLPDYCLAETTAADTTGVIGNRVNGALLLITVGSAVAGTNDANVTIGTRVNFVDV